MSVLIQTQASPDPLVGRGLKERRLVVLEGAHRPRGKFEIIGREESSLDFAEYVRSPAQNAAIKAELGSDARRLTAAAILSRHWKRKNSVEEAMLELYHATISVAKADEVARLLWGEGADVALVGECYREISRRITGWLQRKISEPQVYVFFQTVTVKQKIKAGSRISQLIAVIGVNRAGIRQGLAVADASAPEGRWDRLLQDMKQRGLRKTALFVGGNDPAAHAAVARHFPLARYQGCLPHLQRDALAKVPVSEVHSLLMAFDRIGRCRTESQALEEMAVLAARLRKGKLTETASLIEQGAAFQFSYLRFPEKHWSRLHDIEPLKNVLSEFREHIRIIGPIDSDEALTLMVAARMRHVSQLFWTRRRYINF